MKRHNHNKTTTNQRKPFPVMVKNVYIWFSIGTTKGKEIRKINPFPSIHTEVEKK